MAEPLSSDPQAAMGVADGLSTELVLRTAWERVTGLDPCHKVLGTICVGLAVLLGTTARGGTWTPPSAELRDVLEPVRPVLPSRPRFTVYPFLF